MKPPITDTQRRFLREVARRLPPERVREVYLFNPMKQGGIETGVAVFAAGDEEGVSGVSGAEDEPLPGPGDGALQAAEATDPTEAAAGGVGDVAEPQGEPVVNDPLLDAEACVVVGEATAEALAEGDVEVAVEVLTNPAPPDTPDTPDTPVPPARPPRITIYTARYRLQLKGPDRGKWEVDVVEEADAPLVTVDVVVRGVQRRAGEMSGVERLEPEAYAAALDEAPWTSR